MGFSLQCLKKEKDQRPDISRTGDGAFLLEGQVGLSVTDMDGHFSKRKGFVGLKKRVLFSEIKRCKSFPFPLFHFFFFWGEKLGSFKHVPHAV